MGSVEKAAAIAYDLYNENVISEEEYTILNQGIEYVPTQQEREDVLREVWKDVAGVPIDPEKNITLAPTSDGSWPAGTNLNELLSWFDARCSGGVASLLYR